MPKIGPSPVEETGAGASRGSIAECAMAARADIDSGSCMETTSANARARTSGRRARALIDAHSASFRKSIAQDERACSSPPPAPRRSVVPLAGWRITRRLVGSFQALAPTRARLNAGVVCDDDVLPRRKPGSASRISASRSLDLLRVANKARVAGRANARLTRRLESRPAG